MAMLRCRYFSGYKPCGRSASCDARCTSYEAANPRILIVHLEALGAVLRATSLLPAIKRQYPHSHITWVTQAPAHHLLQPNGRIDRVLTTSQEDQLVLRALEFDLAFVIDKSLKAAGVLALTRAKEVRGFVVNPQTGAILPANPEAEELWRLGLSDDLKFNVNRKPETQLMIEALALGAFQRDEYQVPLTADERALALERRHAWGGDTQEHPFIIGLNTGCSPVIPYKKWSVSFHRQVVAALQRAYDVKIVLLGGPEDEVRNQQIAAGLEVVQSPTHRGLRDGLASVEACDVVVTGDSLGMHMAIALRKWTVAWFGPTCAHEIDLYDRGVRLLSSAPCAPCWKRTCSKTAMCYDQVPINSVLTAVRRGLEWKTSSSKLHSSETLFSPSL